MIDRKTYLEMCQKCAVIVSRQPAVEIPKNLLVKHNDIEYYPVAYVLSFDKEGNAVHYATFHDLKANSINGCLLSELEEAQG